MEPRQLIRSGITASVIAHLSFLGLVIFLAEVHPFASVTAEPIAVDLVAPDEVMEKKPEPPAEPKPSDSFDPPAKPEASGSPPSTSPPAAAAQASKPLSQQAAAAPAPSAPVPGPQPSTASASSPAPPVAYTPPEPDISIKYHVLLGLPQDRPGDGFDAPAAQKAEIASDMITEFRNHLRSCSTLPKSIVPTDRLAIKLRVLMNPDGRLAAKPALIEASASDKGPALMQSAIEALQACQPYGMLPADRYGEWKILDLKFTPQDFVAAS